MTKEEAHDRIEAIDAEIEEHRKEVNELSKLRKDLMLEVLI